ncbi:hypothetical protein [Streptomyces wuyuanensis]|uniref:hypothetical protein n=1 Tax=Streptomyces wuyuanensis TaxID=1196353 RepID=UPI00371A4749
MSAGRTGGEGETVPDENEKESPAHRSGRLWGALHTLRVLGGVPMKGKLAHDSRLRMAERQPGLHIPRQLDKATKHLVAARRRGARHGKAADEVLKAVLESIPGDGGFPETYDTAQQKEFRDGFRAQKGTYAAAYRALLR